MQTLYLSLLPNNWIKIKSKASTKPQFMEIIDNLRKIPVIRFDNKDKSYISSIFFIDHIYKLAEKYGYQVYETENLDYYIQRFKLKMERIKQEKQNTQFNSKYWTDDPNNKILPYQAQAINVSYAAKHYLFGDDMGCLSGDLDIIINCRHYTIKEAYEKMNQLLIKDNWQINIPRKTRSLHFNDNQFYLNEITKIIYSGKKKTIKI